MAAVLYVLYIFMQALKNMHLLIISSYQYLKTCLKFNLNFLTSLGTAIFLKQLNEKVTFP